LQQRPDGSWDRSGPHTVLVNSYSATSHYYRKDKSVTIPIHRDHSNMVKFSRGDAYLVIITSSIAELCTFAQLINQSEPAVSDGAAVCSDPDQDLPESRVPGDDENYSKYPSLVELSEILSTLEGMFVLLLGTYGSYLGIYGANHLWNGRSVAQ